MQRTIAALHANNRLTEREKAMSREIKFRAWHKDANKMYEVLILGDDYIEAKCTNQPMLFEHVELMQYTGLKDKNGVEIYEGDVIEIEAKSNGIFKNKVELYHGVFGFFNATCRCVKNPDGWDKEHDKVDSGWFMGGFSLLNGKDYSKVEECDAQGSLDKVLVIGNIHQNPELLK